MDEDTFINNGNSDNRGSAEVMESLTGFRTAKTRIGASMTSS